MINAKIKDYTNKVNEAKVILNHILHTKPILGKYNEIIFKCILEDLLVGNKR